MRTARGQALFEACLAAPLLLGLVFWVAHCGALALSKVELAILGRQAARVASAGGNPQAEVQQAVQGYPWLKNGVQVRIRQWGWGITAEVGGQVVPPMGGWKKGSDRYWLSTAVDTAKARLCWY